jgi:hypothetical protein
MRKLILISALVLASATAQAGQSRGLVLASNDTPNSGERIESVQPDQPKAEVKPEVKPEASRPEASKPVTEVAKPAEVSKPVVKAARPAHKPHSESYASEEARARSIAARYGISW